MNVDGLEEAQIVEALRRSMQETDVLDDAHGQDSEAEEGEEVAATPIPREAESGTTNGTSPMGKQDVLYALEHISIDPTRGKPSKNKIHGRLALLQKPGSEDIFLDWKPRNSEFDLYGFRHNLDDIYSLRRKGSQLFVMLLENGEPGVSLPPLNFDLGSAHVRSFLHYMQENLARYSSKAPFLRIDPADGNRFVVQRPVVGQSAIQSNLDAGLEQAGAVVGNAASAAKITALENLSHVTRFFQNAVHDVIDAKWANQAHKYLRLSEALQQEEERETVKAQESIHVRQQEELGSLGDFDYLSKSKPLSELAAEPRESPVDMVRWRGFFDEDNTVIDEVELRRAVFKGGVTKEVRKECWCFLLGHWSPNSESEDYRIEKKTLYETMKLQWTSVTAKQLDNNSHLRERIERVAKDVSRTDRDDDFFKDLDSPNLTILNDILCTWCVYNFDLGYVQGMSDMAAVILKIVQDEVDAFWCFVGLMDTIHGMQDNFRIDQKGMNGHLEDLKKLLRIVDPALMEYLEATDSGNLFFMFRWLLINFKREFVFDDIVVLWEVMWTKYLSPKFHLFVCLGIVALKRDEILEKQFTFDELLAYVNDLQKKLDLNQVLGKAEAVYNHLVALENVSEDIKAFVVPFGHTLESIMATEKVETVLCPEDECATDACSSNNTEVSPASPAPSSPARLTTGSTSPPRAVGLSEYPGSVSATPHHHVHHSSHGYHEVEVVKGHWQRLDHPTELSLRQLKLSKVAQPVIKIGPVEFAVNFSTMKVCNKETREIHKLRFVHTSTSVPNSREQSDDGWVAM